MLDLCRLIFGIASDLLRSQVALEAEILVLRQQINVLRRTNPKRLRFVSIDRLILGGVCRLFPKMYGALAIVRPGTVIRWHRAGFRSYWRWKSKHRCGRPAVTVEIRQLIRQMSGANPLWGAPRIHGELLKLGIDVGQTSVAKYMVRRRVQLTEACGWEQIPRYLVRDRDGAYGEIFIRRVRSIGIRDRPTSPRSPWQNAYAERLIGSIRRECLDHIVVFGERHLRHVLLSYMDYYNGTRTHLSLNKDAPISRSAEAAGRILCRPILGGLHHQYARA